MLKLHQIFRSKKHNVFTEEFHKIALNGNDDKRIQSIGCKETYAYGTSENIRHKTEDFKHINIVKQNKND